MQRLRRPIRETAYPVWNIDRLTKENTDYRRVLYTGHEMQVVLMTLLPGQEIGKERHEAEQFIKVESGRGWAEFGGNRYDLSSGTALLIPPNTHHNVGASPITVSPDGLKFYTIYSPPQHPLFTVQQNK